MVRMMKTAIVGGGAAGFFLAVNLKERIPEMQVSIFEQSRRVLTKVKVSGGGRCNCTNSFAEVTDLKQVYPRGYRLMKRLMNVFDHRDAYEWFERNGVALVTQEDECVFPASQDSHTIINCFVEKAKRMGVDIQTGRKIASLNELADFDFVAVTTGGSPRAEGLRWLADAGHDVETPCPSLFTFNVEDTALRSLMGTVVERATVQIPGTKFRAQGALLLTHWGMSGPAILRLSSYAARHLAEQDYQAAFTVNWISMNEEEARSELTELAASASTKLLTSVRPFGLPTRLWQYLLGKLTLSATRWGDLTKKDMNRLTSLLTNDAYELAGRGVNKEEFVTCGGISLASVNPSTLESRVRPNLYFAGEVLDIDGVTGGFNFQAAWTTAYVVAQSIAQKCTQRT